MRTKPDSHEIETFVDSILEALTPAEPMVYESEGVDPVDLSNSDDLRRVLKDGIYGVLWGRYSSKTRVSVADIRKALKKKGLSDSEIEALTTKS